MRMMQKFAPTLVAFILISMPALALAADCPPGMTSLCNPTSFTTLDQFLAAVLHAVVLIAFPIIVLFLIYIGWLFVFHGNEPAELKKTKEYFVYAILGALIVLGAEALSRAIAATVTAISGPGV
jgi:MFS-type transporter involved in bile tolerance (Atg22 family)